MKKLYKFHWDCGRMGDVHGLFIATEEEVGAAIGSRVYFGEILGKHSEVYGVLDTTDLSVILDDQDAIAKIETAAGCCVSGHNPLDYLEE